jgi:Mrp family chromosome partitioning ATPase
VAVSLARAAADDGERVLLIDVDRGRQLTSSLAEGRSVGFREVLEGRALVSGAIVKTPWQRVDLLAASSGAGTSAARQSRQLPSEAISGQLRAFDLVVVDGRLPSSDPVARNFSNLIDDVVIVLEAGVSTKDELRQTLHTLNSAKVSVRGTVLVGAA